jgi:hypothetical protein
VNLRYPNITGPSDKEQLTQIKGYLYQLVNDLNYSLSVISDGADGKTASTKATGASQYEGNAGEVQYSDLRALLAQELQRAENLLNQIETDLANGKFNGPQGPQGEPGEKGEQGEPGVSVTHSWEGTVLTVTSASGTSSADLKGEPGEKGLPGEPGKDYVLTEEDKAEIVKAVLDALKEQPNEEE